MAGRRGTLLLGIIQFSLWFWGFQVGAHAAQEGARQYAVDPCGEILQIISAARARGQQRLVEMNQQVLTNLDTLISSLTEDPQDAADTS